MNVTYAIFCEDVKYNSSTRQVSTENIFSMVSLEGPGTTDFSFLFGISDIKKGDSALVELIIQTPDKIRLTGRWNSPVSDDEYEVYNSIFNCSNVPLKEQGIYTFIIMDSSTKKEISRRYLRVKFSGHRNGDDSDE